MHPLILWQLIYICVSTIRSLAVVIVLFVLVFVFYIVCMYTLLPIWFLMETR